MSLCGFHLGWHSDACPLLSEYVEGAGLGFPLLSCLFGRPGWRTPLLSGWFWSFPPPPGSAAYVLCSPLLTCLCGAASQVWGRGQAECGQQVTVLSGDCLPDSGLYVA